MPAAQSAADQPHRRSRLPKLGSSTAQEARRSGRSCHRARRGSCVLRRRPTAKPVRTQQRKRLRAADIGTFYGRQRTRGGRRCACGGGCCACGRRRCTADGRPTYCGGSPECLRRGSLGTAHGRPRRCGRLRRACGGRHLHCGRSPSPVRRGAAPQWRCPFAASHGSGFRPNDGRSHRVGQPAPMRRSSPRGYSSPS